MDALQQIFVLITDAIPKFCAQMIGYFFLFFTKPYPISKLTMRALRARNMTSITLLLFSYTAFAIILGIPSTGRYIVAFDGGLSSSLQAVWHLDTKGREFYYLIIFVLSSTIVTILLCEISKTQLPKEIRKRTEFFDLFNIFIAFSIGWFMIVSLIVSIILGFLKIKLKEWSSTQSISTFFKDKGIPDITDILYQPAIIFVFFVTFFIANNLFNKWAGRKSLYKILVGQGDVATAIVKRRIDLFSGLYKIFVGQGVGTEIFKRRIDLFPGISFVFLLVSSSLLLAFMARALFLQVQGDEEMSIHVSCQSQGDKLDRLFVSSLFENNTTESRPINSLFIKVFDRTNNEFPPFGLRIEPADIAWLSEKGLFLEAGEKRYYRLLLTLPQGTKLPPLERLDCAKQNDFSEFKHPRKVEGELVFT